MVGEGFGKGDDDDDDEAAAPDWLTGGNGEAELFGWDDWFGNGAGNAPCAITSQNMACPQNAAIADRASGISKRRTITVFPQDGV